MKDRNGKDLTEAEEIKKRWQEYTEELYKKILMTQVTMTVWSLTHLELNILECEVKWTLGSITTNRDSGGDGIPAELCKILKNDDVKVLQQIWKTQQLAIGLVKVSFHSNQKKSKAKEYSNYHTIALISHANRVMLVILQARLQQYRN